MKALSLTQPWASLVAIGAKNIETRSWNTNYRGWLAIHASKAFPGKCRQLVFQEPFFTPLHKAGLADIPVKGSLGVERLPQGAIIAVVNLYKVGKIGRRQDGAVIVKGLGLPITGDELVFGNYVPGRYAWCFGTGGYSLKEPIPCRGALGLWTVPPEIEARIREQVSLK